MKKIYHLLILILVIAAVIFACEKDKSNNISTFPDDGIGFRGDTLDYDDCPAIKDSVYKSGGMLVFKDMEHFEKCALCLEFDYDTYNDQYDAQYPNATPEELDSLDEVNEFDQWTPYLQFENNLGFSSFRAKIEGEFTDWLALTSADSIDFDDDPNLSTTVFTKSHRALLNEDGYVKVGSDTLSESDWETHDFDNCSWFRWTTLPYDEYDDPVLENRQIKMTIGIMSGIPTSFLWGQIRHLKLVNGHYTPARANIKVSIYGVAHNGDCEQLNEFWSKTTGFKKREILTVRKDIWAWREAMTNDLLEEYPYVACRAYGYWESDGNEYPVWLVQ